MKTLAIISIAALMAMSCGNNANGKKDTGSDATPAVSSACSPSGCGSCTSGCGASAVTENVEVTPDGQSEAKDNYVEILYFHGKQRCATCMAIESNAKEAVESNFADRIKNGSVVFRVIDISKKENEAIAAKYEVTWSSLFVVKHSGGKETAENMTEFAFGNARKSPEVFKAGVVKAINDRLR